MERVVIEFAADTEGLQPALAALQKLGVISEEELQNFQRGNEEFKKRQSAVQQMIGPMDKLANSANNVTKNLASGAVNKAIDDTKKNVEGLGKAADETKKKTEAAGAASTNVFRAMRKEFNELVAAAEAAYKAGDKALGDELIAKAGKLQDSIGDLRATTRAYASDTAQLDAIAQGLTAISAGFQIAHGASALFGTKNKDLNETLVKLQGSMALVNGLTQIQNALQKESALRIGLANAGRTVMNLLEKIGITTKLQMVVVKRAENAADATSEITYKRIIAVKAIDNGLTSSSVAVRWLATAAQWALNAAMYAFPLFAIVGALIAVIALLGAFGDEAEEAAEQQALMNKMLLNYVKAQEAASDVRKAQAKDREDEIQREIDLLKASGGKIEDIRALEDKLAKERKSNADREALYFSEYIQNLDTNRQKLVDLNKELAVQKNLKEATEDDDYDAQITALETEIELTQKLVDLATTARDAQADANQEIAIRAAEAQRELEEDGLKSRKASIEAKLKLAKQGSDEQFALERQLAAATRDLELHNDKLTAGEREKIYAEYKARIMQIDEDFARLQMQNELSRVNAQLSMSKKGSEQEFLLKKQQLELQRNLELNNMKLTDDQRKEITAKYYRQINDLEADFRKKQTLDTLNTQKLLNDAELQLVQKGSDAELELKRKNLLIKESIEIASIDKELQGTEQGEAKKAEIQTRYLNERIKLQADYVDSILKMQEDETKNRIDYLTRLGNIEANSLSTSLKRRQEIEREQLQMRIDQLEEQKAIEKQRYTEGVIDFQEYQRRLTGIVQEENALQLESKELQLQQQLELEEAYAERIADLGSKAIKVWSDAASVASARRLQELEEELAFYEDAKNREIITEAEYERQKAELQKKIRKEKTEQAKKEKEFAVAQILLETGVATVKALGTPPVPNFLLAGITGGFGLAQAGIAAARPIPQFAKGTKYAPRGWAWVGEVGPELVKLNGGEEIKTHADSMRFALKDSLLNSIDNGPRLNSEAFESALVLGENGVSIDYNKLAKVIRRELGEELQNLPLSTFSFDKHGFKASIHEGNTETRFYNDRYSSS